MDYREMEQDLHKQINFLCNRDTTIEDIERRRDFYNLKTNTLSGKATKFIKVIVIFGIVSFILGVYRFGFEIIIPLLFLLLVGCGFLIAVAHANRTPENDYYYYASLWGMSDLILQHRRFASDEKKFFDEYCDSNCGKRNCFEQVLRNVKNRKDGFYLPIW